jgi:hypothetical protein
MRSPSRGDLLRQSPQSIRAASLVILHYEAPATSIHHHLSRLPPFYGREHHE